MAPRPWMRGSITLILSISRKEREVRTGGSRLHRSRGTRWISPRMLRYRRLTTVGRLQRLASGSASIPRHDIPGTLNPGILASRNIIRIFCNVWFIGIIKINVSPSLEVPWHYSKPQYNMVMSINETYGTHFLKILSRSDSFLSASNLPGLFL